MANYIEICIESSLLIVCYFESRDKYYLIEMEGSEGMINIRSQSKVDDLLNIQSIIMS